MLLTIILKLGIASILGMIIGLERELKRKPLGLKTSTVICIASCLITIVSIQSAYTFPKGEHINMDPLRLAAQIISGVGFLGAGVILVKGLSITGLTTAAMIWGASGLGISVGAGFWREAIIAMIFIIAGVEFFPNLLKKFGPGRLSEKELQMSIIVEEQVDLEILQSIIKNKDIIIQKVRVKDLSTGERKLEYKISTYEKRFTTSIYQEVRSISGVVSVEIETIG
ncbi:MgtC/SapB family protein [Bacillus sp. Brlt_9]|uniref:MgtC/SapB family protein n=1 Tax=Bacillus sp. Brlt_9 TaxID=3110916 RepID=UPI003F7BB85E